MASLGFSQIQQNFKRARTIRQKQAVISKSFHKKTKSNRSIMPSINEDDEEICHTLGEDQTDLLLSAPPLRKQKTARTSKHQTQPNSQIDSKRDHNLGGALFEKFSKYFEQTEKSVYIKQSTGIDEGLFSSKNEASEANENMIYRNQLSDDNVSFHLMFNDQDLNSLTDRREQQKHHCKWMFFQIFIISNLLALGYFMEFKMRQNFTSTYQKNLFIKFEIFFTGMLGIAITRVIEKMYLIKQWRNTNIDPTQIQSLVEFYSFFVIGLTEIGFFIFGITIFAEIGNYNNATNRNFSEDIYLIKYPGYILVIYSIINTFLYVCKLLMILLFFTYIWYFDGFKKEAQQDLFLEAPGSEEVSKQSTSFKQRNGTVDQVNLMLNTQLNSSLDNSQIIRESLQQSQTDTKPANLFIYNKLQNSEIKNLLKEFKPIQQNDDILERIECPICMFAIEPNSRLEFVQSDIMVVQTEILEFIKTKKIKQTAREFKHSLAIKNLEKQVFHRECFKVYTKEFKKQLVDTNLDGEYVDLKFDDLQELFD